MGAIRERTGTEVGARRSGALRPGLTAIVWEVFNLIATEARFRWLSDKSGATRRDRGRNVLWLGGSACEAVGKDVPALLLHPLPSGVGNCSCGRVGAFCRGLEALCGAGEVGRVSRLCLSSWRTGATRPGGTRNGSGSLSQSLSTWPRCCGVYLLAVRRRRRVSTLQR